MRAMTGRWKDAGVEFWGRAETVLGDGVCISSGCRHVLGLHRIRQAKNKET